MDRRALILCGAASAVSGRGASALGLGFGRPDPFTGYVGMAAPDEPEQRNLPEQFLVQHRVADLWVFAEFSLEALVLSTKAYRRDRIAAVSPLDLALGWGPSSDPERIRGVTYWQRDRWYFYQSREPFGDEMRHSSANMHMIPADPDIEKVLRRAEVGNLVRITGHLCDIHFADGYVFPSSRTRNDTGAGSCEVVLVSEVRILM